MPLQVVGLPALTFSTASTTSNAIGILDDSWGLTLYSPSALTGTITVQVEPTDTGTNFVDLQSGGVDVTLPAGKATVINPIPFRQLRLITGTTEAAARTFTVTKSILV
jgi:hypothetical protein